MIIGVVLKLKLFVLSSVVLIMFRFVFSLLLVCSRVCLCRLLVISVWCDLVMFSFYGILV